MIIQDDRTEEQKKSLTCLVIGTDSFLSGWGEVEGGASYAAWACAPELQRDMIAWVERRGDMKRVRVVYDSPQAPYRPNGRHARTYISTL